MASKRCTNALIALFPAPTARKNKEKKEKAFQSALTLPMILVICYKYLVFPSTQDIVDGWRPGKDFLTATALLLLCYTGGRPCQVT